MVNVLEMCCQQLWGARDNSTDLQVGLELAFSTENTENKNNEGMTTWLASTCVATCQIMPCMHEEDMMETQSSMQAG